MQRRNQVIDHFKMSFPIHRSHEREKIKGKRRIKSYELADGMEFGGGNGKIELIPSNLAFRFGNLLQTGKLGLNGREDFSGGHEAAASAFFLAAASMLYPSIFFCRARTADISASGRGGQPGTYTSTGITLSTPLQTE